MLCLPSSEGENLAEHTTHAAPAEPESDVTLLSSHNVCCGAGVQQLTAGQLGRREGAQMLSQRPGGEGEACMDQWGMDMTK